ncbi:MAG: hemerythrin domain-containing protein [Beijerinckiaceae bacterium]
MQLISDYMNRHHKYCDDAFARAEDMAAAGNWAGLERDCSTFLREMERHIRLEEELLFPAFEEKTGMTGGPTAIMRMEHEQMRGMFVQMRSAMEAKDREQYLGAAETLLILLQQHNMKEESMMYPMLDQSLGEDAHSLLAQIESIAA